MQPPRTSGRTYDDSGYPDQEFHPMVPAATTSPPGVSPYSPIARGLFVQEEEHPETSSNSPEVPRTARVAPLIHNLRPIILDQGNFSPRQLSQLSLINRDWYIDSIHQLLARVHSSTEGKAIFWWESLLRDDYGNAVQTSLKELRINGSHFRD